MTEYVQELIQLNSKISNTGTQRERKEALTCIQKYYENLPMQYTEIFLALKIENFQLKNFVIFLIFAQNINCGYTLEPPRRGGSNEYPQFMFWSKNKKNRHTPAYPVLLYIKVGFKWVYITRTCFHDET